MKPLEMFSAMPALPKHVEERAGAIVFPEFFPWFDTRHAS
jgi:hypothetical protein